MVAGRPGYCQQPAYCQQPQVSYQVIAFEIAEGQNSISSVTFLKRRCHDTCIANIRSLVELLPDTLSKTFLARVAPVAPQEWYDTRTITSIPWEVVCNHPLPTHVATQLLVSNLTSSALFARGNEPPCMRIFSAAVANMT